MERGAQDRADPDSPRTRPEGSGCRELLFPRSHPHHITPLPSQGGLPSAPRGLAACRASALPWGVLHPLLRSPAWRSCWAKTLGFQEEQSPPTAHSAPESCSARAGERHPSQLSRKQPPADRPLSAAEAPSS